MTLHLTHIGIIMLKHIPLLRLPQIWPQTISVKLGANKFTRIDCNPDGTVWMNGLLAGYNYPLPGDLDYSRLLEDNSMQIVGTVEYREY